MRSCRRQRRPCPETTTSRSPRLSGGSGRLRPGRVRAGPGDEGFWGWVSAAELPGGEGTRSRPRHGAGAAGAGMVPSCLACPGMFRLCLGELSSPRGGLIDLYLWIIITLDRTA